MSNRIDQIMALVGAYGAACGELALAGAEKGMTVQAAADQAQSSARAAIEAALEDLDVAESELCRLTHHKRGDGCSIPNCRNYRPQPPRRKCLACDDWYDVDCPEHGALP